jgi:N-acetylated-alpha-linked acidic dipeptidase
VDTRVTPIWNTMASIPGHLDEVIVIGCHRDGKSLVSPTVQVDNYASAAWVMGAADPTSGTVSLLEVIRGFGVLLDHGWKPLRTIVFASWDGEEVCAQRHAIGLYC